MVTDCKTTNAFLAVAFASAGSVISAIGYVIEKKAHNRVNLQNYKLSLSQISLRRDESDEKSNNSTLSMQSFVTNKLWCSGFFIFIIGSIFQAAALKFGAQSVVTPLGSLTLVANAILATNLLNEPFNLNDILGTLFIVIGSVLAVLFGPRSGCIDPSLSQLKQNYLQTQFLILFISLTGITLIDFIGTKYLEYVNHSDNVYLEYSDIKVVNNEEPITNEEKMTTQIQNISTELFLMISYVFIAAYFGSINVLLMKSTVIIIYTINIGYLKEWFFWLIIGSVIMVNVCLEYFRQRALKYFAALFVIPIYQVLLVIGSILMGATYFNEFQSISTHYFAFFVGAIVIILSGIGLMAFNFGTNQDGLTVKMLSS